MVIQLIIVWALGVVAFFSLWAILTKVIKRISERKHKDDPAHEVADTMETTPEQHH
jgi:flagellar biosynthesis/type III secretory pathway M-ring protein FliF/YscJ